MEVSHNGEERGYIVERWVDSGRVAYLRGGGGYILGGRGTFWEGGIDSGSIAYSCRKGGYILERWGRFWEPRLI